MKNSVFLIIFLLAGLSLFGQNSREAKIYVPPVEGKVREGDNAYFHKQLTYEVIFQHQTVVRNKGSSDYIFKGAIELEDKESLNDSPDSAQSANAYTPVPNMPVPHVRNFFGRREFFSMEAGSEIRFYDTKGDNDFEPSPGEESAGKNSETYIFTLEMLERSTGDVISSQAIVYSDLDSSLNSLISIVVSNMLYEISEKLESANWLKNWVFLEMSVLWLPRQYKGDVEFFYLSNYGVKIAMEVQFASFMSMGIGAIVSQEEAEFDGVEGINELLLEVPALLKFDIVISDDFVIEPYGGVSLNYSLSKKTIPSQLSWFAGLQFNFRAGAGAVVIDPRFSMDFYSSGIPASDVKFSRYSMQFGIGQKTDKISEY